jgi:hypothetical protein
MLNFTIVHIGIAFVIGYTLGAIGMWVVFKVRSPRESIDSDTHRTTSPLDTLTPADPFEGLVDDDQTRIQTRPNLAIAKAAKPTPPHGFYTPNENDIENDIENTEDTEDLQIEVVNVLEHMTDEIEVEDVLGNDDTLPFLNSKWERPQN